MAIIQERKRNPLEDLSSMVGDLKTFVRSDPNLTSNEARRKRTFPLLDLIANEIYQTAGRINIEGIDDYSLKLVKAVMNAHEPRNRPKIYEDEALFYLHYALKDASIGKLRPVDMFILINELAKRGIKAHYSGCECPLYLLEIP